MTTPPYEPRSRESVADAMTHRSPQVAPRTWARLWIGVALSLFAAVCGAYLGWAEGRGQTESSLVQSLQAQIRDAAKQSADDLATRDAEIRKAKSEKDAVTRRLRSVCADWPNEKLPQACLEPK